MITKKIKTNTYNYVHNILRYFDRCANFLFTTSEKKGGY